MPFVLLYLVVEIVALTALVSWLGFGVTVLVLLAGTVLGLWLARREGLRALQALAEAARERRVAHVELTDGLLVAMGGLLLVVPGVVTDVAGLLLLLPPTRSLVRRRMVRAAEEHAPVLRTARIRSDGAVIDGAIVDSPADGGPVAHGAGAHGAVAHGPVVPGPVAYGPVAHGPVAHGPVAPGPVAHGPVAHGAVVDGEIVSGAVVDGAVVDGAVVDGAVVDGTAVDGAVTDERTLPHPGDRRVRRPTAVRTTAG